MYVSRNVSSDLSLVSDKLMKEVLDEANANGWRFVATVQSPGNHILVFETAESASRSVEVRDVRNKTIKSASYSRNIVRIDFTDGSAIRFTSKMFQDTDGVNLLLEHDFFPKAPK